MVRDNLAVTQNGILFCYREKWCYFICWGVNESQCCAEPMDGCIEKVIKKDLHHGSLPDLLPSSLLS